MYDRRDLPFLGRWRMIDPPEELRALIEWPHAPTRQLDRVEETVIAQALHAGRSWSSYSRRKNWYADAGRYLAPDIGYAAIIRAVDRLAGLGLIEHDKKRPSPAHRFQSRFRASALLLRAIATSPGLGCRPPRSPIMLRDSNGQPIAFDETPWTRGIARNVAVIEEMLASVVLDLDGSTPCLSRHGDFLEIADRHGNPYAIHVSHVPISRIFNCDWDRGGRFVGPAYQSWPLRVREHITIDGEETQEADFGQLHARLLCARAGLDIDAQDIFDIPGFDRALVKRVFYILLNAPTLRSALAAVADERPRRKGVYRTAAAITEAIKQRFPTLAPYLHSGIGLELMRAESGIAEAVMLRLQRRGIVVLPVHDSLIGRGRETSHVVSEMHDVWAEFVGSEIPISLKQKSEPKSSDNKHLQQKGITTGREGVPVASGVGFGGSSGVPWGLGASGVGSGGSGGAGGGPVVPWSGSGAPSLHDARRSEREGGVR